MDAATSVPDGSISDASASDASTGAGSGGDASPDAASSACSAGLFCEDFETGKIDPNKWDTVVSPGSAVDVQQQTVAHGKYAMHVHGQSGPSDWALLLVKNAKATLGGTSTFGRVNFFTAPAPLTSGHTQMVFAGMNGTGSANGPAPFPKLRYMEVSNIGGGWQVGFDLLDVGPLVEEVAYPKGRVPISAWTCLEWTFNDQPTTATFWIDGTQVGTFDNTDIAYASPGPIPKPGTFVYNGMNAGIIGGFDSFGVGFHDWHPNMPFDLYYDDFVLGTKRIGCMP